MKKKNVSGGQRAGRAKPGASRPSGTKGVTSPVSKRRMDGLFSGVVGHPVKAIGSPIDARLAMGQETLKAFQAASESLNAVLEAYSAVPAIISDRIRIASETIATIAAVPATFSSHIRAIQDHLDMASSVSAKLLSMAGPAFKAQAWPFGHPHLNTGIVDALRTLSSEPDILEAANRALEVAAEFASGLTSAETVLEARHLKLEVGSASLGMGSRHGSRPLPRQKSFYKVIPTSFVRQALPRRHKNLTALVSQLRVCRISVLQTHPQ